MVSFVILILGYDVNRRLGLEFTAVWNSAMIQTSDVKNAMIAGMQKRKPTFEKL